MLEAHPGLLGHALARPKDASKVVISDGQDASITEETLANIAAEPHGLVVKDGVDDEPLERCYSGIEVAHSVLGADDRAETGHCHDTAHRVLWARIMHQRHVLGEVEHGLDHRGVKLEGGQARHAAELGARTLAGGLVLKLDSGGDRPKAGSHDAVHHAHHAPDHARGLLIRGSVGLGSHERRGELSQLHLEHPVHRAAALGMCHVGETRLGHDTVLLDDGHEHVPLPAVVTRGRHQVLDHSAVGTLTCMCPNGVEEEIRALDLIPEEEVGRRQLEALWKAVALDQRVARNIARGEHPAPARRLLACDICLY